MITKDEFIEFLSWVRYGPYFSNPIEEEMKEYNDYIRSISKPTGVNIFDFMDEPQTLNGGEDVHEFCKRCSESKARMIDGERYIVCEKASDMACVSIKKCPLGKWVCEETYIVVPQTDCALMKGADDE